VDAGDAEPEDDPGEPDLDVPEWLLRGEQPPQTADDEELPPDKAPGHLRSAKAGRNAGKPRTRVRVTATVRKDVQAKIGFVLYPAGQVWSVRDPFCGGTFLQQVPDISEAMADLVCDSPDLLAWFTGPAGGFMKYFKLIMAVQPVAMAVWAHHIAHGPQPAYPQDAQQPPQMPAYAA